MAAKRKTKAELADELEQIKAQLADAEARAADAEADAEELGEQLAEAQVRAVEAEGEMVTALKKLPKSGPYRVRLRVLGKQDGLHATFRKRFRGTLIVLAQRNKKLKGRKFDHDPQKETIFETEDRELAELLLASDRRIEPVPPAAA